VNNSLKPLILGVQGHQGHHSSAPVLVVISSMSVPIGNHFHTKQANSCKIITFMPSFTRNPLSSNMKFCHKS